MNQKLEGQIRHILTLIAGVLVTFGIADGDIVDEGVKILMSGVGFVLAAIAFVRSWITKPNPQEVEDIVKKTVEALKES